MFLHQSMILFIGGEGVWQTSLWADTPQAHTPPFWADTAAGRQPPGRHPLARPPHDTATAADGTHSTGMHSCWYLCLSRSQRRAV